MRQSHTHDFIMLILLLSSNSLAADKTAVSHVQSNAKLLIQAQQQQQKLIETYGLSQRIDWQIKCLDLIKALALIEFKQCYIIKAAFKNAYSLAHGSVILTEGLLKNIHNDDQLAHVMAHEHAHLSLNHHQQTADWLNDPPKLFTKSRIKKFYRSIEQQADQAANNWLKDKKRDPLQIQHYLLRIEQGVEEQSQDHQKLKDRIQRKGLPDEVIESFWTND